MSSMRLHSFIYLPCLGCPCAIHLHSSPDRHFLENSELCVLWKLPVLKFVRSANNECGKMLLDTLSNSRQRISQSHKNTPGIVCITELRDILSGHLSNMPQHAAETRTSYPSIHTHLYSTYHTITQP